MASTLRDLKIISVTEPSTTWTVQDVAAAWAYTDAVTAADLAAIRDGIDEQIAQLTRQRNPQRLAARRESPKMEVP